MTISKFQQSTSTAINRTITSKLSDAVNVLDFGTDYTGIISSRLSFQNAITYLTSKGGGTITGPKGDYLFDTNSEATCLVCTVPIIFDFPPGTTFKFGYYDLALINFVGCNGGGIKNIEFVFTGTRPGSSGSLTASHFGFNGTGVVSPPDFAAFVSILGASNIVLDNVQWRGNDAIGTNLKEVGVQIAGGSASGPNLGTSGTTANPGAGALYSYGNKLLRCKSNDAAFGVTCFLQDGMQVVDFYSDRYYPVAFVGAGHVIYNTGMSRGSIIRGLVDNSTQLFALTTSTFAGASTLQLRSWVNGIVDGVQSKRVEGLCGIFNSTSGSLFSNVNWRANRVAQEGPLVNSGVITIIPSDSVSVLSGNTFSNWYLEDQLDSTAGRSSNVAIFGSGGASAPSANIVNNVYDGIYITHYPDSAFGKSVVATYGQRERWRVYLNSRGSANNKALVQLNGSAAGLLSENILDVTLAGSNILTFNVSLTNSTGTNVVNMHATGNVSQQNSTSGMIAGDKYLCDDAMYSTRADLINNVLTHKIIHSISSTATVTVPTPAPGLTFVGSTLDFTFNATSTGPIAWPASFRKAADGATTSGKSANTKYVCTDAVTPIWVQMGGPLTFN